MGLRTIENILLLLLPCFVHCEVFTSLESLRGLIHHQQTLISHVERYLKREEDRLKGIRSLLQVKKVMMKQKEQSELRSLHHPLTAYSLVRDWSIIHDEILDTFAQKEFSKTTEKLPLPKKDDRLGAMHSILRLQSTYNIPIDDLTKGNIRGHTVQHSLSKRNIYDIAMLARLGHDNRTVIHWLEYVVENPPPGTQQSQLSQVHYDLANAYIAVAEYEKGKEHLEKSISLDKTNVTLKTNYKKINNFLERNANGEEGECTIPNRTFAKYESLCSSGQSTRELFQRNDVWCAYDSHTLPYLTYRMEVLSADPWVVIYYNIITEKEIGIVKKVSIPQLSRATVGYPNILKSSNTRISKVAWLYEKKEWNFLKEIDLRIQDATGLETKLRKTLTSSEPLQVVNYGIGGQFTPHMDAYHNPKQLDNLANYMRNTGDRLATFMLYLSDVMEGGGTVFPQLGIHIPPIKGAAAFWYNFYRSGAYDRRVTHAGCPVLIGEKWVANKWIREYPQWARHRCGPNLTSSEVECRTASIDDTPPVIDREI